MTLIINNNTLMAENIIDNYSINSLLEKLGLSKNEVKCYLAVFTLGSAVVSEIAKVARINRVNAYSVIKTLMKRGLVEQEITAKGQIIHTAPLDHLQALAQDHQKKATKLRWRIEDLLPKLEALCINNATPSTIMGDVIFFRGEDTFYRIADRTLAVAPQGSEICFLESHNYFLAPERGDYGAHYISKRLDKNITARLLHPITAKKQFLQSLDSANRRETRFMSSEVIFPCSIYIYGDEIAFLWTKDQEYGITINGGPLVQLMKAVYEMIWSKSLPTK